jgi:hypothetical protein
MRSKPIDAFTWRHCLSLAGTITLRVADVAAVAVLAVYLTC